MSEPILNHSQIWPTEIRLTKDKDMLIASFENGRVCKLSAEYLRVHSPSAEVQGHSPDQRKIVSGKQAVLITDIQLIGNYAVKLIFDDHHATGIFSWGLLRSLDENHSSFWQIYLADLEKHGLHREAGALRKL